MERTSAASLRRGDLVADLSRRVVTQQVRAMTANRPGTLEDRDPESLHDLRVATRRLRFALRLFAPWLGPGAAALRRELRWIALRLGAVRDLDVFAERLRGAPGGSAAGQTALGMLLAHVDGWRAAHLAMLRRALLSTRWKRLTAGLAVLGRDEITAIARGGVATVAEIAPIMVGDAARRVARRGVRALASGRAADLHAVRIAFKGLRYTTEFVAPAYGAPARQAIRAMVSFQDCLGAHHDAIVARRRLFRLRREITARAAGPVGALVEALLDQARHDAEARSAEFVVLWPGWRELRAGLDAALGHDGMAPPRDACRIRSR